MSPYRVLPAPPAPSPPLGVLERLRAALQRWQARRAFLAWIHAAAEVDAPFWTWRLTGLHEHLVDYLDALDREQAARLRWHAATRCLEPAT